MLAKEIMTTKVIPVSEETPITQIAEIVSKNRIHGVPVIDQENKVVGIITETDFFTKEQSNLRYIPQLIDFFKSGKSQDANEKNQAVEAMIHATAKDIMTKGCITAHPETSIEELISLVKKHGFNSFPVVDEAGTLVGIVAVYDMIKII